VQRPRQVQCQEQPQEQRQEQTQEQPHSHNGYTSAAVDARKRAITASYNQRDEPILSLVSLVDTKAQAGPIELFLWRPVQLFPGGVVRCRHAFRGRDWAADAGGQNGVRNVRGGAQLHKARPRQPRGALPGRPHDAEGGVPRRAATLRQRQLLNSWHQLKVIPVE
jgi:hypothetical protein